jgi:hypothetical protein
VLQPPAIGQSNALECIRIEQVREVADRIGERDPTSHPCHLVRQPDLDAARARLRDETGEVARMIRHLLRHGTQAFSSRLSSLRKRQSALSAISLFGLDLIIPASCRRRF